MNFKTDTTLPIGVFDSGMGGLTVLNALMKLLPNENFIYLGDTARLPYGTKSKDTVIHYSYNASRHLIDRGIKLLVVACNTASSVALETLKRDFYPVPVIGVIQPSAEMALTQLPEGPIAVIATEGTVKSRAYTQTILEQSPNREVIEWPCSLLVALSEEGWHSGPLVEDIIKHMLTPLWQQLDNPAQKALLLGCTHFPVLKSAIQKVIDQNTIIIDSACSVADAVLALLKENNLVNHKSAHGKVQYLVTDGIERFQRVGKFFLDSKNQIFSPELVSINIIKSAQI